MKLIDLFAGTGAFSTAFKEIECIFANDNCPNSAKLYNINHKNKIDNRDIKEINPEEVLKIKNDNIILCMGFPCQSVSISGKRLGFKDPRASVFWDALNIIKTTKPRFIIIENVKNLTSHDKGKTFKTVLNSITKLGYGYKYSILNTYLITGIPQNRERIYIVCFRDEEDYDSFDFNFPTKKLRNISEFLENNIPDKYYYKPEYKVYDKVKNDVIKSVKDNVVYQYRRYYIRENKSNVCPTLTANMGTGGHNIPIIKDEKGIRKLTPRECFNLQGFPKDYKFPNKMSDSALYKLAGNAVSLPVVELIAKKIINI